MSTLTIKIVSKKYNKILSRAEAYLKKVRSDEKYYFLENFMFITLFPSKNKITSYEKTNDGLLLKFKNDKQCLNTLKTFENSPFFKNLKKKMYYNNLIFEVNSF